MSCSRLSTALLLAAAGLLVGSGFSEAEQDFASTLPTVSTERAITCDDLYNVQQLSCDSGVISVQAALYGRADSKTCSEGWSPQQLSNTNCAQQGTTSVLKERCDGKRVCQINTNVLRTSDPCYGIYKYLDTIYTCIAEKRSVTCEGSVLNLQCDKGKVLYIHSADYGRHDQTTCSYQRPAGQVQNVQCSRASNIVAQSCNGRNSCTVSASNSVFGDPCVGTYKYLEVAYICYCPQLPAKN
ncbi:L-rhamnose-binding lectin SML-like isoform X1 [Channa argus]